MVLADRMAAVAATVPQAGSDRAPAEVALVAVGCAVLICVAVVVVRRARVRVRRPDPAPDTPAAAADPADAVVAGPESAGTARWRLRGPVLVPAIVAVVLVSALATAVYVLGSGHETHHRGSAAAAASPVPGEFPVNGGSSAKASPGAGQHRATGKPGAGSALGAASPGPGRSAGQGGAAGSGSGSGLSGSSNSSAPSDPSTSAPNSPPPASPTPTTPTLVLPASPVELPKSPVAEDYYDGYLTLTAVGGAINYTASVPSGQTDYNIYLGSNSNLSVSGVIEPGSPFQLLVEVDPLVAGGPAPYITVNGETVTFSFP
jgi:hypothetical protein